MCMAVLPKYMPGHHVCALPKESRRGITVLELEFRAVWITIQVLGMELWSSGIAAQALNHCAISTACIPFPICLWDGVSLCFPGYLELTMWARLALNSTRDSPASFSWVLWYRRKLLDRLSLQSLFSKYSWDGLRETLKWPSVGREVWNNQNCPQSRTRAAVCSVEWNQTVNHGSRVEQSRVEGNLYPRTGKGE